MGESARTAPAPHSERQPRLRARHQKRTERTTPHWRGFLPKGFVGIITVCFLLIAGCSTPGMRHAPAQSGPAPSGYPQLLAVYMPWFGDHNHIDVGYSSQDPVVLREQIRHARQRGISGFVVDWNGERSPYSDRNFALLEQLANEAHFHVALLYNEAEEDAQATEDALAAFDRAYAAYIGPRAQDRDAYLTYQGRPIVFVFPKSGHTDWNRVQEQFRHWQAPPLLVYKDQPPAGYAADFAGSYAWVQPGKPGWKPDGSNWGEQYLDDFYRTMKEKHADKIVVGGAWPSFNDSGAAWGLNRHMDSRCGQTLDDTLGFYQRYYAAANPIPFVLIETWNDYEEGTAIERTTSASCPNPPITSLTQNSAAQ